MEPFFKVKLSIMTPLFDVFSLIVSIDIVVDGSQECVVVFQVKGSLFDTVAGLKLISLRSVAEEALKSVIPPLAEIVFPTMVIFVPAVNVDCFVITKLLISFILLSIVFNLLCRFVILEMAISLYKASLAIDETSNISCSNTVIFKLISLISFLFSLISFLFSLISIIFTDTSLIVAKILLLTFVLFITISFVTVILLSDISVSSLLDIISPSAICCLFIPNVGIVVFTFTNFSLLV